MRKAPTLFALLLPMGLPGFVGAQAASPAAQPAPVIYRVEPISPEAGEKITIVGRGFLTRNAVVIGRMSIRDVPVAWSVGITCVQGDATCHPGINQGLSLTVPPDAAAGQYNVSIENENGVSNVVTVAVIAAPTRPR